MVLPPDRCMYALFAVVPPARLSVATLSFWPAMRVHTSRCNCKLNSPNAGRGGFQLESSLSSILQGKLVLLATARGVLTVLFLLSNCSRSSVQDTTRRCSGYVWQQHRVQQRFLMLVPAKCGCLSGSSPNAAGHLNSESRSILPPRWLNRTWNWHALDWKLRLRNRAGRGGQQQQQHREYLHAGSKA